MLSKSASRALGSIIATYKRMKFMGFATFDKLYKACIHPILDYGSPVWGLRQYQNIEQVQYRAMRTLFGVSKFIG